MFYSPLDQLVFLLPYTPYPLASRTLVVYLFIDFCLLGVNAYYLYEVRNVFLEFDAFTWGAFVIGIFSFLTRIQRLNNQNALRKFPEYEPPMSECLGKVIKAIAYLVLCEVVLFVEIWRLICPRARNDLRV
jgi:hypothetical protein